MENKRERHDAIARRVCGCTGCALHRSRKNTVPGEGNLNARLMLIGEGPGAQEDEQGRPFVGKAGALLELMLDSIGLTRDAVYIANVVKCRPPNNRVPGEDEAAACLPYLWEQIELIDPKFLLLLGSTALRFVLDPKLRITASRGKWFVLSGRPVIATFHPAALLRDPSKKVDVFKDLLAVDRKLKGLDQT